MNNSPRTGHSWVRPVPQVESSWEKRVSSNRYSFLFFKINMKQSRQKDKSDKEKRYREHQSHIKRLSATVRKKATITIYQEMAMDILQENGIVFVKEKVIPNGKSFYLIDIYLPEYRMCVEVDWSSHDSQEAKYADRKRDTFLHKNWYWTFRIKNKDVKSNFLWKIKWSIKAYIEWKQKKSPL